MRVQYWGSLQGGFGHDELVFADYLEALCVLLTVLQVCEDINTYTYVQLAINTLYNDSGSFFFFVQPLVSFLAALKSGGRSICSSLLRSSTSLSSSSSQ